MRKKKKTVYDIFIFCFYLNSGAGEWMVDFPSPNGGVITSAAAVTQVTGTYGVARAVVATAVECAFEKPKRKQ